MSNQGIKKVKHAAVVGLAAAALTLAPLFAQAEIIHERTMLTAQQIQVGANGRSLTAKSCDTCPEVQVWFNARSRVLLNDREVPVESLPQDGLGGQVIYAPRSRTVTWAKLVYRP